LRTYRIALIAVLTLAPLSYAATQTADDPAVAICEAVLKAQLKAPKSYERVEASIDKNEVSIVYDAVNEFNAPLRHTKICAFGKTAEGKMGFVAPGADDAKRAIGKIRAEIATAKAKGITDQQKQAFEQRINDVVADTSRQTAAALADLLVAAKIDGYPIDPTTTVIKAE
jgi:hypothetical protein